MPFVGWVYEEEISMAEIWYEGAEYMEAKEQESDSKKKLDEAAKSLNEVREPIECWLFWVINIY